MKRTFAIIAVLAAALALPAVAGATGDSENTSDDATVTVPSAIQMDVTDANKDTTILEGDDASGLRGLSGSQVLDIGFDQDVPVRSNATFEISLAGFDLAYTGSGNASGVLSVTGETLSAQTPNADNDYQALDVSGSGGVDWGDNAGSYTGSAVITATNSY